MFQIILVNPNPFVENNPFRIDFNTIYVPPAPTGDLFIVWIYDDNDILV